MNAKYKKNRFEHWHVVSICLIGYDLLAVAISYFAALWIRFDCHFQMIPAEYLQSYFRFIPIYMVFCVIVFWLLRLYKSIWQFASYSELVRVAAATGITLLFHVGCMTVFVKRMPVSYFLF